MQTYLYCVPFASTMNRFGKTAVSNCYSLYCVCFERTMDKFGITAASDGASVQCPPDCLVKSSKNYFHVLLPFDSE